MTKKLGQKVTNMSIELHRHIVHKHVIVLCLFRKSLVFRKHSFMCLPAAHCNAQLPVPALKKGTFFGSPLYNFFKVELNL